VIRVRVQKIESIKDPEGNLGKRVELVEDRILPKFSVVPRTEEARMVQGVIQALQQQIPIFGVRPQFVMPKIILFLTEHEYEELGVRFEVNQVYEIDLHNKTLRFKRIS